MHANVCKCIIMIPLNIYNVCLLLDHANNGSTMNYRKHNLLNLIKEADFSLHINSVMHTFMNLKYTEVHNYNSCWLL